MRSGRDCTDDRDRPTTCHLSYSGVRSATVESLCRSTLPEMTVGGNTSHRQINVSELLDRSRYGTLQWRTFALCVRPPSFDAQRSMAPKAATAVGRARHIDLTTVCLNHSDRSTFGNNKKKGSAFPVWRTGSGSGKIMRVH